MDEKIKKCISANDKSTFEQDKEIAEIYSINTAPVFIFNNQYKKGGSLSIDILDEYYCKINDC